MKYHFITLLFISLISINKITSMENTNQKSPRPSTPITQPLSPHHSPDTPVCPGAPIKKKFTEERDKTHTSNCKRKLDFKN